ncbi:Single-strand annealing protein SAK3 [uncultured Caudovirales phage]|uniref:Single-strand annealing protein SAK3 n=1 Tax=uncultured Caudovirales phage TaxID=2100421 RepID=A0A6J5SV08_9CAUD|nr:Single-strand annealing protein SAK3 [uncultured Caudovirales phage]CAB4219303.1 Single-strand annealing protein SAK3 [uncultured Caudovirales phage]
MSKTFTQLRTLNVNDRVESKEGLSYLSWAWAWDEIKQHCPDVSYEVIKTPEGLPYFESHAGAMVYTKVTIEGVTHEMWLPVMDSKNKAMKREPYAYKTRQGEKMVEAFTMFDVNKTIMRCLVKNLAMFGLALYIYAGEDIPSEGEPDPIDLEPLVIAIQAALTMDDLKKAYIAGIKACKTNQDAQKVLESAKDSRKIEISNEAHEAKENQQ